MSWTITIYGANVDTALTNSQAVTTTVAALSGVTSGTFQVLQVGSKYTQERTTFQASGGHIKTLAANQRKVYEVEFYPFVYDASTSQDLDDRDSLMAILKKKYIWIKAVGGSRNYPTDTSKVIGVNSDDENIESINKSGGHHSVTLTFKERDIQ